MLGKWLRKRPPTAVGGRFCLGSFAVEFDEQTGCRSLDIAPPISNPRFLLRGNRGTLKASVAILTPHGWAVLSHRGGRAVIRPGWPWHKNSGTIIGWQKGLPLLVAVVLTILAVVGSNIPAYNFFDTPDEYIPPHSILEFVAIAVSAMVCGLGWNLRQQQNNSQSIVLASAFLAVAVVDLLHTLSYTGMPRFVTPSSPEKAINFWLAGRAIAAIGLLCIAGFPSRHWSRRTYGGVMASTMVMSVIICWVGLWHADWLPRTFIPGQGLTPVKIGSEYLLMVAYTVAAMAHLWRYRRGGTAAQIWMAVASWTLALGESFFTLYSSVTDLFNLLGHFYKAAAYLIIYRALFVEGVNAPYRALALERAHLKTLLATIPDLVWLKDRDGVYLLCNPEFERFFGAAEAQIVGRTDYDFVDRQLADFFRQKDRDAMAAGKPSVNDEWVTFACDGHKALLETIKTPMLDSLGRLTGVLGIARDITSRMQTEATLKKANEDLAQFAYVASHDLREPLRMVSSYITLLERRYGQFLDEEGHEFISFARDGAQRMDRMVLDLLEFSRVGRLSDAFSPLPLAEVIGAAVKNLALMIKEGSAEIVVADNLPMVTGARDELIRLFQNLIGNAVKYRHQDRPPVIRIACQKCDDGWQCSVADNGIGIAEEYFDRIFGIFQRLHTREQYEGTGIGLAICKKIVQHHGGRIWVESQTGQGSTFFFTIQDGDAAE